MNLHRLRELVKSGKDGTLRPEEAKELFEALPEVLALFNGASCDRCKVNSFHGAFEWCASCGELVYNCARCDAHVAVVVGP